MNEAIDPGLLLEQPRFVDRLEDCFFYHAMELPGFGLVRAHWDLRGRFPEYVGGVDVAGKSVLDIGAATGFLSFEAEKRGAARVLSFDMSDAKQQAFLPFKDKLYYRDPERWASQYGAEVEQWKNAYWLCHRLLVSKAEVYYGNVYQLPAELGQFDIAIVGSVLEHLSDQITALASIARCTKETIVLVSPLLQTDERIARFEALASNPAADFTWWTYSLGVYREVFAMLGFSIARVSHAKYYYMYGDRFEERSTIVAVRD
ncbi:MAG TPA: class I SAM-dependent methyltransferase [Pyrinomonadaceae bacterium]|jgi:SAM-dependent methyltransferase|nr:class I SAM-dependent methyltransferase [Pyrinomonadaceae bacterium]